MATNLRPVEFRGCTAYFGGPPGAQRGRRPRSVTAAHLNFASCLSEATPGPRRSFPFRRGPRHPSRRTAPRRRSSCGQGERDRQHAAPAGAVVVGPRPLLVEELSADALELPAGVELAAVEVGAGPDEAEGFARLSALMRISTRAA